MSIIDFEECDCDCHRMNGYEHCMPCCYTCPACAQNIKVSCYDKHVSKCSDKLAAGQLSDD